jgi:hypothetical protein
MTRVSIITPSFNQAAYLEQTILSVLGQDHTDVEYIVIDGGSTDGSIDIIRKYEDRLAGWVSEKDSGQADAINKGFSRAGGEIVAWLNSDDYYLPGAIREAVKVFDQHPDVMLVYGDMIAVDEHGETFNRFSYKQLSLEDLLCFQIIGQPAVFMRRSALQGIQLDETLHFLLDHQLWIQIARRGRILHVDQTWAAARYHTDAKNRAQAASFGREAFRILEWVEQEPSLGSTWKRIQRRARASAHRVDARYLLDGGQPAAAFMAWCRSFMIHPATALARLNLMASSILGMLGLGRLREFLLVLRKRRYHMPARKEHE